MLSFNKYDNFIWAKRFKFKLFEYKKIIVPAVAFVELIIRMKVWLKMVYCFCVKIEAKMEFRLLNLSAEVLDKNMDERG